MTENHETTKPETSEGKKGIDKKSLESKNNTMDIKLINSMGDKIKIAGVCTDREIKAVCKALNHTADQTFEVK
jgi:hypothetical protein